MRDKLDACAAFVTTAWELGAMALADAVPETPTEPYAMGTTATLDRPAENWHPIHAEDASELPVPFIIKWFPVSGVLTRYFLVAQPSSPASEVQLPMLLDEKEKMIAAPPSPSRATLIVGRSGTGKTSIALQKLFDVQVANELHAGGPVAAVLRASGMLSMGEAAPGLAGPGSHTNVLFVTKSLTLTRSLGRQFTAMLQTVGLEPLPVQSLVESFTQGRELRQPLFLSSSEWLTMLDRQLDAGERFFRSEREAQAFVAELSGDMDSLGQLLQPDTVQASAAQSAQAHTSGRQLLTFEGFARWAQLDGWLSAAKLSASSVWREIFSYIKGSAEAMATRTGCLSREQYENLPGKMTSVVPEQRAAVYTIFERYARKGKAQLTFDAADVVCHLSRRIGKLAGRYARLQVLLDEVQVRGCMLALLIRRTFAPPPTRASPTRTPSLAPAAQAVA